MDIITHALLKSWNPCIEGYNRFCELFPDGADLKTAIDALVKDDHDDWGYWLFNKCRNNGIAKDITVLGYRNSGDGNSGDRNSGSWNSGDGNSGDGNSGDGNSGSWNSGDGNSGDGNSGSWNSGDGNSGYGNSGYGNSGDRNSGAFNTVTPDIISVFNAPCLRRLWDDAYKPQFLLFDINVWVSEKEMSDQEKIDNPTFFTCGGYLKKRGYKEAFVDSWNKADPNDRMKVKDLPNFDADIFFEISGIDLRNK